MSLFISLYNQIRTSAASKKTNVFSFMVATCGHFQGLESKQMHQEEPGKKTKR